MTRVVVKDGLEKIEITFPKDMDGKAIQKVLREKFAHLKQPTLAEITQAVAEKQALVITEAAKSVSEAVKAIPLPPDSKETVTALKAISTSLGNMPGYDSGPTVDALDRVAEKLEGLSTDPAASQALLSVLAELTQAVKGMARACPTYEMDVTRDSYGIKKAVMRPV